MVKRNIIILSNSLSAFLIVTQLGIWNALIMFLLIGAIPGTTMSISPIAMFIVTILAIALCAFIFTLNGDAKKSAQKSLPKKRYGRI